MRYSSYTESTKKPLYFDGDRVLIWSTKFQTSTYNQSHHAVTQPLFFTHQALFTDGTMKHLGSYKFRPPIYPCLKSQHPAPQNRTSYQESGLPVAGSRPLFLPGNKSFRIKSNNLCIEDNITLIRSNYVYTIYVTLEYPELFKDNQRSVQLNFLTATNEEFLQILSTKVKCY